jgi:glycosyltransferase involved in cell wall biosynthesis
MVMAEWADDKIKCLEEANRSCLVLTGISSSSQNTRLTKFIKIPPLSWREFRFEISQLKSTSVGMKLRLMAFSPFSFFLGGTFDLVTRRFIDKHNPARWSWAFSALPIGLYAVMRYRCKITFATGGALSGQLLATLISYFSRSKTILEFQDPIVGNGIARSEFNDKFIHKLETFMIDSTYKSCFVTKRAARSAVERNPRLAQKIMYTYPGSWDFKIPKQEFDKKLNYTFAHIGTLYGTRNMDNLFLALDKIKTDSEFKDITVKILNIGAIYLENVESYKSRSDFEFKGELSRIEALKLASRADGLILIQHYDERSLETIPYKTYDYLNLGGAVLGITNNKELDDLLLANGGLVTQANSVQSIEVGLKKLIRSFANLRDELSRSDIAIRKQFSELLEVNLSLSIDNNEENKDKPKT